MKLKFNQTQIEQLPLDNLKTEQFISLAIQTSNRLGWIIGDILETGFIAYTNNGLFSWNAEVKIKIRDGFAELQSHSREDTFLDVIENKRNLYKFISTFKSLRDDLAPKAPPLMYGNLEMNVA